MYCNKILNFQESMTILNGHTKIVWKLIVYLVYIYILYPCTVYIFLVQVSNCTHTHTHTHTHIYIYIYIYICLCMHACVSIYIYIYICMFVCISTHKPQTHPYIYIYMYNVSHRQTVSLYHNSSVWLDTQDSRIYIYIYIYIKNKNYHVYIRLCEDAIFSSIYVKLKIIRLLIQLHSHDFGKIEITIYIYTFYLRSKIAHLGQSENRGLLFGAVAVVVFSTLAVVIQK